MLIEQVEALEEKALNKNIKHDANDTQQCHELFVKLMEEMISVKEHLKKQKETMDDIKQKTYYGKYNPKDSMFF